MMAARTKSRATADQVDQTTRGMVLEELALEAVVPDPRNPRGPIEPSAVEGLAASMRAVGLLQPVRVARTSDGRLLLRAGHRRLEAARLLGWETIPAVVYATDDDDALEAMLVENGQRQDLDPLGEARIVGELLSLPGMTRERVAASLGRSVSWVAKRARLTNLAPAARKAMQPGGVLAELPIAWLEEIALLPPHVQGGLIGKGEVEGVHQVFTGDGYDDPRTLDDLRHQIRSACLPLRLAGWELDDAELVPAVGACTSCPRQTSADPDLFGSIEGARSDALCTDRRCWTAKQTAILEPKLREARARHGRDLLLLEGSGGASMREQRAPTLPEALGKVARAWDWKKGRKNSPGARAAFVVSGPKAGSVEWVVPLHQPAASASAPPAKGPIPLEERRLRLERKRYAHVASSLLELLEHVQASTAFPNGEEAILALGAWGADKIDLWEMDAKTRLDLLNGDYRAALERLWSGCQLQIEQELRRVETVALQRHSGPEAAAAELQAIAQVLKVDLEELRQAAAKAHPEPKSWAAEEAGAGETATKPEKATSPRALSNARKRARKVEASA